MHAFMHIMLASRQAICMHNMQEYQACMHIMHAYKSWNGIEQAWAYQNNHWTPRTNIRKLKNDVKACWTVMKHHWKVLKHVNKNKTRQTPVKHHACMHARHACISCVHIMHAGACMHEAANIELDFRRQQSVGHLTKSFAAVGRFVVSCFHVICRKNALSRAQTRKGRLV